MAELGTELVEVEAVDFGGGFILVGHFFLGVGDLFEEGADGLEVGRDLGEEGDERGPEFFPEVFLGEGV